MEQLNNDDVMSFECLHLGQCLSHYLRYMKPLCLLHCSPLTLLKYLTHESGPLGCSSTLV